MSVYLGTRWCLYITGKEAVPISREHVELGIGARLHRVSSACIQHWRLHIPIAHTHGIAKVDELLC